MNTKISTQQNNISALEAELEKIEDDNAAHKLRLNNMYTLDDIYNVATNELGMVYAKKGQIIYYDSANEDYVKQYQNEILEYMDLKHPEIGREIEETKVLSDELTDKIIAAAKEFEDSRNQ